MFKVKRDDLWLHSVRRFPRVEGGFATSTAWTHKAIEAMVFDDRVRAERVAQLVGGDIVESGVCKLAII